MPMLMFEEQKETLAKQQEQLSKQQEQLFKQIIKEQKESSAKQQEQLFKQQTEMMQMMMQGFQQMLSNNASSKSDISIQSTIGFGTKAHKNAFVQKAMLPCKVFHLEGVDYRTKTEPWNEGEIGYQLLDANVTKELQIIAIQDKRTSIRSRQASQSQRGTFHSPAS